MGYDPAQAFRACAPVAIEYFDLKNKPASIFMTRGCDFVTIIRVAAE